MKVFKKLYSHLEWGNQKTKAFWIVLFTSLFLMISFTGCENFMNGVLLREEIESAIDYANAPSYEVLVTAAEGTGSIIIGSGNNTVKVTDSFNIGFRKASGYKFVQWSAVTKDGSRSMENYVKFENSTELTTSVKLIKASNDIQIRPICETSLSIKEAYPEFKEEGVARDSSIKLLLTAPLSDKNDLSRITIDIDNSNVKGSLHFNEPEMIDNQLVITAKTSNRIAVPEGTFKNLTVTIPADFLYVGVNGEFEIGEDLQHTYRINPTTTDKAFITYGTSEENSGTVKVNGIVAPAVSQQYNIGDTVTVSYKVADGYYFVGWNCSDEGAILLQKPDDDMYDENGYNELTKTATVTLRIINETKNATFEAKVEKIPTVNLKFVTSSENSGTIKVNGVTYGGETKEYLLGDVITVTFKKNNEYLFKGISENSNIYKVEYAAQDSDSFGYDEDTKTATIKLTVVTKTTVTDVQTVTLNTPEIPWTSIDVSSPYGRFSSDASRIYREGEKQSISFTSDPDYQFVCWQVVDLNNGGQKISGWEEYIDFSDEKNPNMTYTLKKVPASSVKLGISPLCAKRPKIVSSTPIYDSDGVYRDRRIAIMFDNEMGENALYFDEGEIPAGMTKIESVKNPGKYYAYKNGNDDSSIVYKCMTINRRTGRKDNLLKHFTEPYYDPEDKSVIRIDTFKDNPPPASTEILVTVLPTVYQDYKVNVNEKASILLGSEYSWAYYTNGKSDNDEPIFGDFDIRFAGRSQSVYDGSARELVTAAITDSTLIEDNNLKSKTLWVKGDFSDGGSGPAGLTWSLRKINSDRFYPEEMDYEVDSGKFDELNIQGSKAEVARIKNKGTDKEEFSTDGLPLDLSNGLIEEGMYRIVFTARDKNDLTATKDFFFVYDETPPAKLTGLTETRTVSKKATVSWKKPNELDFGKIEIVRKNITVDDTTGVKDEISDTAVNNTTYDVEDFNRYEYTAKVYDFAGNVSDEVSFTNTTAPGKISNLKETRTSGTNAKVSWTAPQEVGKVFVKRYDSDNKFIDEVKVLSNKNYHEYTTLVNGTRYIYKVTTIDYSGNENTETVDYTDTTPPAKATSIGNSRTSADKETITWTKPADGDFDHVRIVQYDTTSNNSKTGEKTADKSVTQIQFTNLENQHKYKYRFYSVDYSGNISTTYTEYQDNTPPAPLKIRYSEGRNGKVNVFFTTPNDEDYYRTTVSWEENSKQYGMEESYGSNKSSYKSFGGATNWTLYNYYFRTYDYSGNCSEPVYLQEMGGAMPGMICYAPGNSSGNVFCSINKWEGKNPIGIVADGSDQSKVKILELGRGSGYVYGPNSHKTSFCADETFSGKVGKLWIAGGFNATYNLTDGIDWWKLVRDNSNYTDNNTSNSIWAYLTAKNKNSAVTWWVPARHEWQYVCWNWKSMCSGFTTLGVGNGMSVGELFYVATPSWYNNRCNLVGVGTDDNGKLNEYLAEGEWMQMWTTSWKQDKYYRQDSYGAYVRAMAFVDMR